jgi:hypothetical protein
VIELEPINGQTEPMMKCGTCGSVVRVKDTALHGVWHEELMAAIKRGGETK